MYSATLKPTGMRVPMTNTFVRGASSSPPLPNRDVMSARPTTLVSSENSASPASMVRPATIRPPMVTGNMSPYPVVVRVTIDHQYALGTLVKV